MSPHNVGDIVFSADPVGVGVTTCPHYLHIDWTDFGQSYTNISLGGGKNADWILVTLISFSRSQEGSDCWKIGHSLMSALYLLIERTDFS